jgi:hypothetical protein
MADNGTVAVVVTLPLCQVHGEQHPARFDSSGIPYAGRKVWASVCESAWREAGSPLGTGAGQRYVTVEERILTLTERLTEAQAAVPLDGRKIRLIQRELATLQ